MLPIQLFIVKYRISFNLQKTYRKMSKEKKISIQGHDIKITQINEKDYISLTDMVNGFGDETVIYSWMRNRNTLEYLGLWEVMHNPDFKPIEFDRFRKDAGLNSFTMSPKKWIDSTGAIGLISKSGRYGGGTFAHKDIAFEFGSWLSPQFKLYLITEFQRLKEIESNEYNLEWNVKRIVSKANYTLHTDAIKNHMLPKMNIQKEREWLVYATEADILNVALWGCTAKEWKESNPNLALKNDNVRDSASINELAVLSNVESLNSILIKQGMEKQERFNLLKQTAQEQLSALNKIDFFKSLKYTSDSVYVDALNAKPPIKTIEAPATKLSKFNKNLKTALGFNPKDKNSKAH
jgi:hypothetical protein